MLERLERFVDLLPKAKELRRGTYGCKTRAGVDALLADRSAAERERIVAGVVRHRLVNRALFRVQGMLPRLARRFATLVPIVGAGAATLGETPAPLIVATGHFGPLFFALAALTPRLRGRRVIVVLRAGALYLRDALPLLRGLGFDYVVDAPGCARGLARALRADTSTVVLFAFDNPVRGRGYVPFLTSTIATSSAIARLADMTGATIVTAFWLWGASGPRIVCERAPGGERTLGVGERRRGAVAALYRALEAYVLAAPGQWSGWDHVAADVAGPRATPVPFSRLGVCSAEPVAAG